MARGATNVATKAKIFAIVVIEKKAIDRSFGLREVDYMDSRELACEQQRGKWQPWADVVSFRRSGAYMYAWSACSTSVLCFFSYVTKNMLQNKITAVV